MATRYSPTALHDAINKLIDTWKANPDLDRSAIPMALLEAGKRAVDDSTAKIHARRNELQLMLIEHQAHLAALSELITRARGQIISNYGTDSSQYHQAGGIRKSDRKPRSRKNTP